MLDPAILIDTKRIQWQNNSVWKEMPHRHFFCNNLNQHFSHNKKKGPEKRTWTELYKRMLLDGKIVVLNRITFRVIEEARG